MVLALGILWTGNSQFEERIVTVRYLLFILSGFIAFSTPYLFFPDSTAPVLQLGNVHGKDFQGYLLLKLYSLYWPVYMLIAVILFVDIETPSEHLISKFIYFLVATLLLSGVLLISMKRYIKSGPDSQFWKESEKGRELRIKAADYFKYPLDPGSIPSLINTIVVLLIGSISVVIASSIGNSFGIIFELPVVFLVLMWGIVEVKGFKQQMVKSFYSSNAFFREFFRVNIKGMEDSVQREVEQLWWVPSSLKMHVWQYLVQLDRKIPSGRVVAAGHALIWFMAYQKPEQDFLLVLWVLFALLHHFFMVMTFKNEFSPSWLLRWVGSRSTWIFTRFWMQLRWIVPLLISMNLQLFIFAVPDWEGQILVIAIYLITGFGISVAGSAQLKSEFNI